MGNIINIIVNVIFLLLAVFLLALIITKLFKDKFSSDKTVFATLVDKSTFNEQIVTRNQVENKKRYVIIFDCNGKKKSFYVSEFSYNQYEKGEKGYLTYKGLRLINFSK